MSLTYGALAQQLRVHGDQPVYFGEVHGNATAYSPMDGVVVAEARDGGTARAVYMSKEAVQRMLGPESNVVGSKAVHQPVIEEGDGYNISLDCDDYSFKYMRIRVSVSFRSINAGIYLQICSDLL